MQLAVARIFCGRFPATKNSPTRQRRERETNVGVQASEVSASSLVWKVGQCPQENYASV